MVIYIVSFSKRDKFKEGYIKTMKAGIIRYNTLQKVESSEIDLIQKHNKKLHIM